MEMAANGATFIKLQRNSRGFMTVLSSAACEWFLIFLLLLDGLLSFLLTKFAQYCDLEKPCILCSRLDHILGNEKPEYYRNLLCSNHRSEISSLISCQIHGKLVDAMGMCEDCLLSFSLKNSSSPDTHRLLVSKLGFDLAGGSFQGSALKSDSVTVSTDFRTCSCCKQPWRSRENAQKLLQSKPSSNAAVNKPNIPLPRRLNRRESLKKMRNKFSGPASSCHLGKSSYDPSSCVGYSKVKITSDSESEIPFSDDDGKNNLVNDSNEPKEETAFQHDSENPPKTLYEDLVSTKLNHHSLRTEPPLIDPCMQVDDNEHSDVKSKTSQVAIGHGLGELNWQQVHQKTCTLISLDDIPPLEVPADKCHLRFPTSWKSGTSALSELMSLMESASSCNVKEGPVRTSPENNVTRTSDSGQISINKYEESLNSMATVAGRFKYDHTLDEPVKTDRANVDLGDTHHWDTKELVEPIDKPASDKETVAENLTAKGCDSATEDSKLLLAQSSTNQRADLSLMNTTLIAQSQSDALQITDTSSSGEAQMLQKSVSLERSESPSLESRDGSVISEIEGESVVDRLKRQVEYDKKCMNALYKELEEERSASAIAANQAMAMITRLQEEKASLHMEALQYLRMMEEQAEYDVEALEKANDLLAEKEKEIQDLEAEIEYYRLKFPDELKGETFPEQTCALNEEEVTKGKFLSTGAANGSDQANVVNSSCTEIEDEILYISQHLKNLERRLHQFAHHGDLSNKSDDDNFEEEANGEFKQKELSDKEGTSTKWPVEENESVLDNDIGMTNESSPVEEELRPENGEDQVSNKENDNLVFNRKMASVHSKDDLVALENEISDLNERLEALEADNNFLEHTFNSLQCGSEGLLFIHEIAHQLQELRKLGTTSRR